MVAHGGFIIPNGDGTASPLMAQPDQVDFNTLGNARWGVFTGCEVTISGASTTATLPPTGGVALVNGIVVQVAGSQTVTLGSGGSQPRFDLICVNEAGTLVSVPGTPMAEPLYPDVPASMTLLAAVYCPVGSSNFSNTFSDKRNILQAMVLSTGASTVPMVVSQDAGQDEFVIASDGSLTWYGTTTDTVVSSTGDNGLNVSGDLSVQGHVDITSGGMTVSGTGSFGGVLTASNILRSSSFPSSAVQGAILQRQGKLYLQTSATTSSPVWEELTTSSSSNQPGDIKQSMRSPSQMTGWLPLIGQEVTETEQPQLFQVEGLQQFIVPGVVRTMILPDATERVLLPTRSTPGQTGGASSVTLGLNQIPAHVHGTALQPAGAHGHTASTDRQGGHQHLTQADGGAHTHPIKDPGHAHRGADGPAGGDFLALQYVVPAKHKIDGPVNDSSHTYTVDAVPSTNSAKTGITRTESTGSGHQHTTDTQGTHGHTVVVVDAAAHTHPVSENSVGGGAPINIQPPYLTVYTYIKV